ncbi:MAG: S-layer homology domain-containing protein [Chloroflexota bacterium]
MGWAFSLMRLIARDSPGSYAWYAHSRNSSIADPHFNDVAVGSTFYYIYYIYIETANNHAIISGYDDGSFRPSDSTLRG